MQQKNGCITKKIQLLGNFPQANWSQTDETKSDYIQNKPNLDDYATTNWVKEYIASVLNGNAD